MRNASSDSGALPMSMSAFKGESATRQWPARVGTRRSCRQAGRRLLPLRGNSGGAVPATIGRSVKRTLRMFNGVAVLRRTGHPSAKHRCELSNLIDAAFLLK